MPFLTNNSNASVIITAYQSILYSLIYTAVPSLYYT